MNQEETRMAADRAAKAMSDLLSVSLDYLEMYLLPLADGEKGRAIANQFNDEVVTGIDQIRRQLYEVAAFGDKEVIDERN